MPGLRTLVVARNRIGDAGAASLAERVRYGHLERLDCARCGIGVAGAEALGHALDASSVCYLDVSENDLRNRGAEAVFRGALRGRLVTLYARRCGIRDAATPALATLILESCSLASLDVSENALGPESGAALADAVAHAPENVRECRFGFNQLGTPVTSSIVGALATNKTLVVLGLENCVAGGGEQAVKDLAAATLRDRGAPCAVAVEHPARRRDVVGDAYIATYLERRPRSPEPAAAEAQRRPPWSLWRSIWRKRPREADSKSFHDTPHFLKHVATSDVSLTKIPALVLKLHGFESQAVLKHVYAVFGEFYGDIRSLHRYYSALGLGSDDPLEMGWENWRRFARDCGVVGDYNTANDADTVFVAVNVHNVKDKSMARHEFLEALFRVAMRRFTWTFGKPDDFEPEDPAVAVRKLLEDFVLPAARELPHDMLNQNFLWRDARLYTEAVDLKLKAKEPLLRASFESARAPRAREIDFPRWEMFVDETCRNWTKDAGASARRRASTTEIPRASVLARSFGDAEDLKDAATPGAAAGYFRGVTNLESRLAFSWCQLTVFDRLQRKDYKALSYLEFLEALCRCADFMDPTPDVTLDLKLDAVFEVLERRAERAAAKSGRRAAYVATPAATPKAPKSAPASPRALFKGSDVHAAAAVRPTLVGQIGADVDDDDDDASGDSESTYDSDDDGGDGQRPVAVTIFERFWVGNNEKTVTVVLGRRRRRAAPRARGRGRGRRALRRLRRARAGPRGEDAAHARQGLRRPRRRGLDGAPRDAAPEEAPRHGAHGPGPEAARGVSFLCACYKIWRCRSRGRPRVVVVRQFLRQRERQRGLEMPRTVAPKFTMCMLQKRDSEGSRWRGRSRPAAGPYWRSSSRESRPVTRSSARGSSSRGRSMGTRDALGA